MIRIFKNQLDLQALKWYELPVTDIGHVIKEIMKDRKCWQAINDWRKDCCIRTQECQERAKQRRATA